MSAYLVVITLPSLHQTFVLCVCAGQVESAALSSHFPRFLVYYSIQGVLMRRYSYSSWQPKTVFYQSVALLLYFSLLFIRSVF